MDAGSELPAADAILQHAQFIRSLARQLLRGDEHGADDLAQETWLRYVESPPRNPLDPRPWFARVLRNLAHNQRRDHSNRALREQRAARGESTSPEDDSAHTAMLSSVVEAVLALDEPYRSTIVARYYRGHEPSRIAAETNTPLATVKSRLARAHRQLREHLDRAHGSRDAWGLALGSLVDVSGKATAATTGVGVPLLGFAAVALLVGALTFAIWRSARPVDVEKSASELARATSLAPAARAPDDLPVASGGERAVASGAATERTFSIAGVLRDAAYPPLSLPGGFAGGVKLEVRLVTEPRGMGETLSQSRVETGADGRFSLQLPLPATDDFLVSIAAPPDERWRDVSFEEAVAHGAHVREGLELVRFPHGILEGTLVDPSGAPVPGLPVRLELGHLGKPLDLTSDERGAIRGELSGGVRSVVIAEPGWALLGFERGQRLPAGGESGWRVIVSPSARLQVHAVDARGAGLADVEVEVELDPAEQKPDYVDGFMGGRSQFARTDADGRAVVNGLWAGHKLRIQLRWQETELSSSGLRGDELLFDAAELAGAPIVLRPGETRALTARWNGWLRIEGDVVHADKSPAGDVEVRVYDLGRPNGGRICLAKTRTDARGAIAMELRSRDLLGPLVVLAGEAAPAKTKQASTLGDAGEDSPLDLTRAAVELEPARAVDGRLTVHLVLEALLSIRGRVTEADGTPIADAERAIRVSCARAGDSALRADEGPLPPELAWSPGGRFELRGLLPGSYDLYAARVEWPTFYSWLGSASCATSVPAGSTGVELALVPREQVRIKVRIVGADARSALALRGKLNAQAAPSSFPAAPRTIVVESAAGWPTQATLRFAGISGGVDEHGRWSFGFDSFEPALEFELPAVDPGVYVFGVQLAGERGGRPWFPQASEPLRFEAGEYEIEFRAVPTGVLQGRVIGDAGEQRIGVQLLDAAGRIVPLPRLAGHGRPQEVREIDARGAFRIDPVPLGTYRLRAGRLDELALGRGSVELAVEIGAESSEPLEIRWR